MQTYTPQANPFFIAARATIDEASLKGFLATSPMPLIKNSADDGYEAIREQSNWSPKHSPAIPAPTQVPTNNPVIPPAAANLSQLNSFSSPSRFATGSLTPQSSADMMSIQETLPHLNTVGKQGKVLSFRWAQSIKRLSDSSARAISGALEVFKFILLYR